MYVNVEVKFAKIIASCIVEPIRITSKVFAICAISHLVHADPGFLRLSRYRSLLINNIHTKSSVSSVIRTLHYCALLCTKSWVHIFLISVTHND